MKARLERFGAVEQQAGNQQKPKKEGPFDYLEDGKKRDKKFNRKFNKGGKSQDKFQQKKGGKSFKQFNHKRFKAH